MLGLPKSTEFNKRIPKQTFYENLDVPPTVKKYFVDQIKVIYWRNKIATTTINVAPGKKVMELQVFEIRLNGNELNESVLTLIDKKIPYHILFLLESEKKYQAWIGYKEMSGSGKSSFKIEKYYHTEWMSEKEFSIKLEGLNIDAIYENFVRQIAGSSLQSENSAETLKEAVERNEQREKLQKQIIVLQSRIRKEKQLNKQMQMNTELKRLKKIYESI